MAGVAGGQHADGGIVDDPSGGVRPGAGHLPDGLLGEDGQDAAAGVAQGRDVAGRCQSDAVAEAEARLQTENTCRRNICHDVPFESRLVILPRCDFGRAMIRRGFDRGLRRFCLGRRLSALGRAGIICPIFCQFIEREEIMGYAGFDIANQVILITGGTSGIGRAIAMGCAGPRQGVRRFLESRQGGGDEERARCDRGGRR